jgi:hypothetical protein
MERRTPPRDQPIGRPHGPGVFSFASCFNAPSTTPRDITLADVREPTLTIVCDRRGRWHVVPKPAQTGRTSAGRSSSPPVVSIGPRAFELGLRRALSLRQLFGCDRGIAAVGRFAMRAHGPGVIMHAAAAATEVPRVNVHRPPPGPRLCDRRSGPHLERHRRKLMAVVPLINHFVGNYQIVLGVDGDLCIVADGGGC